MLTDVPHSTEPAGIASVDSTPAASLSSPRPPPPPPPPPPRPGLPRTLLGELATTGARPRTALAFAAAVTAAMRCGVPITLDGVRGTWDVPDRGEPRAAAAGLENRIGLEPAHAHAQPHTVDQQSEH